MGFQSAGDGPVGTLGGELPRPEEKGVGPTTQVALGQQTREFCLHSFSWSVLLPLLLSHPCPRPPTFSKMFGYADLEHLVSWLLGFPWPGLTDLGLSYGRDLIDESHPVL